MRIIFVQNMSNIDSIILCPHNDDEALFCSSLIIRYNIPVIIVFDSFVQEKRNKLITKEIRRKESENAMKILGGGLMFWGFRDDENNDEIIEEKIKTLSGFKRIYVPLPEIDGNPQHNLIGILGQKIFKEKAVMYGTYKSGRSYPTGEVELILMDKEREKKNRALDCYVSQTKLSDWNKEYFENMRTMSEFLSYA